MERLVIFGKGGIGKSTIACNISASLAMTGRRVLHVGCDPKHDSTTALLRGALVEPVVDRIDKIKGVGVDDIVVRSPLGVDCVEAGGPAAGVGCGGRGITRMLEIFNEAALLDASRYEVALYDVLGDVVCGGFAAPLRRGIGEKVVIVTSEELMALYAANNIARAIVHYANNGIALAGLVANLKDPAADRSVIERFAERLDTQVLAWIPRDPLVREAEYRRTTVVEAFPEADISRTIRALAERLSTESVADRPRPTPMDEAEFHAASRARFRTDEVSLRAVNETIAAEQEAARDWLGQGPQRSVSATAEADLVSVEALVRPRTGARSAPTDRDAQLFAELRGEAVFEEDQLHLSRPGLVAGADSRRRFARALGLVGALRSLRRLTDDTIELVAEVDARGTLACGVIGPVSDDAAWRRGRTLSLSYRGPTLDKTLARALLRFMARYDGVEFDKILDQIRPDPGDEHMLASDYPESLFYAYAPSSGWRRFFEGTELYRGASGANRAKVAVIEHTDIECLFNQVRYDQHLPSFFNAPMLEHGKDDPGSTATGHGDASVWSDADDGRMLFTDIGDVDIIKGADALLDQAFEGLARETGERRPESVMVLAGCLPEVSGDDLDASAARTQPKLRLPVMTLGQHNDPTSRALTELVERQAITADRSLEPRSVALLGLPQFRGRGELLGLLERAGVKVLTTALPDLDPAAVELLPRASVLVEYPWGRYATTMARLGRRLAPARMLRPPAPFGLAGTRRWLRTIAAAVGREAEADALIDAAMAPLRSRWRMLHERAQGLRLGFIVDHPRWRTALMARRSLGVPLLELVCEMGFDVDVLAYADSDRPQPPATHDRVRVRHYASLAELESYLAAGEVAAWYSELHYDRRLTRSGAASFSMRQLEMGFEGASRSLEALLGMAELPFYRRYAAYLGPAFPERNDAGVER